jgi:hypothetical protein
VEWYRVHPYDTTRFIHVLAKCLEEVVLAANSGPQIYHLSYRLAVCEHDGAGTFLTGFYFQNIQTRYIKIKLNF